MKIRAGQLRKLLRNQTSKYMQSQYERLTDPQWEIMKNYLPVKRKRHYPLRSIVDGIFWYLRIDFATFERTVS
jgi:hypothetical protein